MRPFLLCKFVLFITWPFLLPALVLGTDEALDTVWVAEADGALRVLASDGTPLTEIINLGQIRALDVDLVEDSVWLLAEGDLYRYRLDGSRTGMIALNAPASHHATVTAHFGAGGAWVAVESLLWFVDEDLEAGSPIDLGSRVRDMVYDPVSDELWIATEQSIERLPDGAPAPTVMAMLQPQERVSAMALNRTEHRVWLALPREVAIFDREGKELTRLAMPGVEHLATDHGEVWAATAKELLHLASDGSVLARVAPFGGQGTIVDLVVTWRGDSWTADANRLARVTADGDVAQLLAFNPPSRIWQLGHAADVFPPSLELLTPGDVSCTSSQPMILLAWEDTGSGIHPDSISTAVDGAEALASWQTETDGAIGALAESLSDGVHVIEVTVADHVGNVSEPASSTWTLDTIPPSFSTLAPAGGFITNQPDLTVSGVVDEAAEVRLDYAAATLTETTEGDGAFAFAPVTLTEGTSVVHLTASDCAANSATADLSITLDTIPPAAITTSLVAAEAASATVTVIGSRGAAEPLSRIALSHLGSGAYTQTDATDDGSFSAEMPGAQGDTLRLVARDRAGNTSDAITITVQGSSGPGDLPPDPATVAPSNDLSVTTDIAESVAFLYSGPDPIQRDVEPGVINETRVGVIRGRVVDRSGAPVAGARVGILGREEFGWTLSRADGFYDLAVNGGGPLAVELSAPNRLTVQRHFTVDWRGWHVLDDVVMIRLDQNVTVIETGAAEAQIARGSVQADGDGERQATLVFPAGTMASMVFADGTRQPLSTLHVRATEYTAGPSGPDAMPGELPPASGYTYAVELSVDEAMTAGATSVEFDRPVPLYVENFLGFPTGGIVPLGYYDRAAATWVPSRNGKVVQILDVAGGLAVLDVDGSGTPAAPGALTELGVHDEELRRLADLYEIGTSLWRSPIPHFTPWDCNWPFGPPSGAKAPPNPRDKPEQGNDDDTSDEEEPECTGGSIIECQNQTVRKRIGLPGVPIDLEYSSSRSRGREVLRKATIRLTDPEPAASLKRVEVEVAIAGQRTKASFAPEADLSYAFLWDGRDVYGRRVSGSTKATVKVSHVYPAVYLEPAEFEQAFATFSTGTAVAPARQEAEVIVSKLDVRTVESPPLADLGSWNLSGHHLLDRDGKKVLMSDGTTEQVRSGFRLLAGDARVSEDSGDGGPATDARFRGIAALSTAPDGSVYVFDVFAAKVRRISPSGIITTVAGNGDSSANSGDGGLATEASLWFPRAIAVSPAGELFISTRNAIRRVDRDGIISTLQAYEFEGLTYQPGELRFGPKQRLHAYSGRGQIIRYEADGTWTPIAGAGWTESPCFAWTCPFDDGPALDAIIASVRDFTFDRQGVLYALTYDHVRAVTPDGIIRTIAGGAPPGAETEDGTLALDADLDSASRLTFDADGQLLILDNSSPRKVWRLAEDGRIYFVVHGFKAIEDGIPPLQARLESSPDFEILPDGTLILAQGTTLWSVRLPSSRGGSGTTVVSRDGSFRYQFDRRGRHLETRSTTTEAVLATYQYDADGLLVGVTDAFGNQTQIERYAEGTPIAIKGPYGSRVELATNEIGQLESVTYPSGASYSMEYSEAGILAGVRDPLDQRSSYSYSYGGRLLSATDEAGETKKFDRASTGGGYEVTQTTRDGREIGYQVEKSPGGGQVRTQTHPDGTTTATTLGADDAMTIETPDGSHLRVTRSAHPRHGMQAPLQRAEFRSGGQTLTVQTTAVVARPDPANPSQFIETEITSLNGKQYRSVYNSAARTLDTTTPEGRTATVLLDALGRVVRSEQPGVVPTAYEYDERGRLESILLGEGEEQRVWTLSYGDDGRVETATDPLGRSNAFSYDPDGKVTAQTREDGTVVEYVYDLAGRLTSLTPPGQAPHGFGYTPVSRPSLYSPPVLSGVGDSVFQYDGTRRLVQAELGDGSILDFDYDIAGRLDAVHRPEVSLGFSYDNRGRVRTVSRSDGTVLTYGWLDGLLGTETWSGEINGSVSRTYNPEMKVRRWTVNGASDGFSFDRDGLLVRAGALTLTRDPSNAYITDTSVDLVTTTQERSSFAEISGLTASAESSLVYDVDYDRDALGRVTRKVETIASAVETFEYDYDPAGRLERVLRNGEDYATYAYDNNGNRTSAMDPWGIHTATHDAQDRLLTYGDSTFSYNGIGQLESRTKGSWTTSYDYDAGGNLRRLGLPNGQTVEYLVDPTDRRIGKRIDGVLIQGFLYRDELNPIAELDGAGNLVARFVYGTLPHVPDLMVKGGRTYRYVTDHLGSVRLIVDTQDGTITQRIDYDPFGRVLFDSNPGFQPIGFAGGLHDRHAGMVRFGARDYDPETGRWTAKDPIGFLGGDTNLYVYSNGDPINFQDIDGRKVINNSDITIYVKPSEGGGAIAVEPGETYDFDQDGIGVPGRDGDRVFKTVDGIDVIVDKDGQVDWEVSEDRGAIDAAKSGTGQYLLGGWKDREWNSELHDPDNPDHGWDELFDAVFPGESSCPLPQS